VRHSGGRIVDKLGLRRFPGVGKFISLLFRERLDVELLYARLTLLQHFLRG